MTDYLYQIKDYAYHDNSFVFPTYDYALNYASYEIRLPDEYEDFYFEGLEEGLTLSPNEVFSLDLLTQPDVSWGELLEFTSSKPSVARIVNNKIVASGSGKANIKVRDPETNKLCGDVDFAAIEPIASAITPVPGGVGPMTITCLMENTIECFLNKMQK